MKRILTILLGIGLSYTAYANNENKLTDNKDIDARNTAYLQEQIAEAWRSGEHDGHNRWYSSWQAGSLVVW